ncbi:MAG TPA: hypothetical protein VGD14_09630 [bacterium]
MIPKPPDMVTGKPKADQEHSPLSGGICGINPKRLADQPEYEPEPFIFCPGEGPY